jgi:hypothetical protein
MKQVLQFKITLLGTEPAVWRQIQIAETCTFWDLHVAIQNAMGWQDCHLHEFSIFHNDNPKSKSLGQLKTSVGIPDTEFGISEVLAGWETKIEDYLVPEHKIIYEYDFGDGWEHEVEFEGYFERIKGNKYPCCLAGEMACPPEDVGGIPGYYDFIEVMNDRKHPEYENAIDWYGGKFDPKKFDATKIKFHNAKSKLRKILD